MYGELVGIVDGDTIKVRVQGVVMEFRLGEVDAPEFDQPYGADAKRELANILRTDSVVLVPFDTDRYGRVVAHVWLGGLRVNHELVSRGAAWFDSRYTESEALYYAEDEARAARRGLWALPAADRLEPWEWRERKREKASNASK